MGESTGRREGHRLGGTLRRSAVIAVASMGLIGLAATPSFADIHTGGVKNCGGSYLVNTFSRGYGNGYHNHTLGGTLKKKTWTGLQLSVSYDHYYASGWSSVDSWAVQTDGAMDSWSASCIN
ncbi:hypothetical protein AB0M46_15110 [Dactylosporangium sp. NPDC051485]|uniref:hypothetical protein n=1 Tax=Dactylosporangium sp. NPDC051485 TaxID=3154846 RepID=UPI00343C027A